MNPSARARLREILDSLYDPDDIDVLRLPDLVDQVTRQVADDVDLTRDILHDAVDTFVREIVQRKVASSRGLILMGDEIVSREAFEVRVRQRAKRFERWLEHSGDHHIQLLAMRKGDLLLAAAERERRGIDELKIAALWRRLADKLTDTEQVGDHFTTEEIAILAEKLKVVVAISEDNGPVILDDNPDGSPPAPPTGGTPATPPRKPRPSPPSDRVRVPTQPRLRKTA